MEHTSSSGVRIKGFAILIYPSKSGSMQDFTVSTQMDNSLISTVSLKPEPKSGIGLCLNTVCFRDNQLRITFILLTIACRLCEQESQNMHIRLQ